MSNSQIPQPNPGSAPAEIVSSTDDGPHGPVMTQIGNPGPPPKEVTQHTLQHNNIDRYFYTQYVFCQRFEWSTADQAGKLLWFVPIHPKSVHSMLDVISSIYNAWGGGFDYRFQVAGTGFHAGKLCFVRVPPNIHPTSLAGNYSFTAFENVTIDAKTLEVETLHGGDQRPINYHYTMPDSKEPDSWEIGGYMACYVELGLNTASTGTQQIQIIVRAKCGSDFVFSQPKFPDIQSQLPDSTQQQIAERMFDFSVSEACRKNISSDSTLDQMIVQSSGVKTTSYQANCRVSTEGEVIGGKDFYMYNFTHLRYRDGKSFEIRKDTNQMCINTKFIRIYRWGVQASSNDHPVFQDFVNCTIQYTNDGTGILRPPGGVVYEWAAGDDIRAFAQSNTGMERNKFIAGNDNPFSPPRSESFLVFAEPNNFGGGFSQTQHMAEMFHQQYLKGWIPSGQCALFSVIDVKESTPIMFVKLYREGIITAAPIVAQINFLLANIQFKFVDFIGRTQAIPLNSPSHGLVASNRLLFASEHRRMLKALRKSQNDSQS